MIGSDFVTPSLKGDLLVLHREENTMKKLAAIILFILILAPSIVSAHTGFSTSNPTEGQVVVTELNEITLTFEGVIEKLSTMKLLKEGSEIPFKEIQVADRQMLGTLPNPLANGVYHIQWTIAGEDGHPIKGEINFSVQMEEEIQEPEPTNNVDNQNNKDEQPIVTEEEEQNQNKEIALEKNEEDTATSSTGLRTTMIIGLLAVVGIGFLLVLRKKR